MTAQNDNQRINITVDSSVLLLLMMMMMMMDDVRVKELGPGEIKPSSDTPAAAASVNASSLLSAQKSDLALLRNANVRTTCHFSTLQSKL